MQIATEPQVRTTDLQFEINLWINDLSYYKKEIQLFNKQLEEIISNRSNSIELSQLEHFQNQFIRQIEVIDELRHDVKQHENAVEAVVSGQADSDHLPEDHASLEDRATRFKQIYNDLRSDFMSFTGQ